MPYQHLIQQQLEAIKQEGRYRIFANLERKKGSFPLALHHKPCGKSEEVVIWCSNDYLGLGQNPDIVTAMKKALDTYGAGAGGTRNISGTHTEHVKLERTLADFHHKQSALLFTSGYVANEASLYALGRYLPNCVFFSDAQNHASMIHGMRYSGAQKKIFPHNDMDALEKLLQETPASCVKIIAFEAVYSMEGDMAPIGKICQLAQKYKALTYIDEVHSIGVYGTDGRGLTNQCQQQHAIDIIASNFGKAVGVIGGYIAASDLMVDFIRSYAPPFIFTTALPPSIVVGVQESFRIFSQIDGVRKHLWERVQAVKQRLQRAHISFIDKGTHIIPLHVGDPVLCKEITDYLLTHKKIYVQPINYPTVPKGQERIRVTPTPQHTPLMIDHFVESIVDVWQEFGLHHNKVSA